MGGEIGFARNFRLIRNGAKTLLPTMILVVAATEFELAAFRQARVAGDQDCLTLVAGVGPVETALHLTRFLVQNRSEIDWVLNIGVAGAYVSFSALDGQRAGLLDLCLAETEVLGDSGLCYETRIEPLAAPVAPRTGFVLDPVLRGRAREVFQAHQLGCLSGPFVTVNCASATLKRGTMLARQYHGLCENMEGAAVARVCEEFELPLLELRCISNLVEDRDLESWRLTEACALCGQGATLLCRELIL